MFQLNKHITLNSPSGRMCVIAYSFAMLLAIVFSGCSNSNEPTDTPTSGEVNVVVDESFRQLFDTEIYTFEAIYAICFLSQQKSRKTQLP